MDIVYTNWQIVIMEFMMSDVPADAFVSRGYECVECCESAGRAKQRVALIIYVCGHLPMATSMIIRFAWKQLKRHRKGKLNEHYSISGSARGK